MIKIFFTTTLVFIIHIGLIAQVANFNFLTNVWDEGKISPNGTVGPAEVNRGGHHQLDIYRDGTVTFSDPFACGQGRKRDGVWILGKEDSTLIFNFNKTTGYMNNLVTAKIDEQEIYKIEKIKEHELIIRSLDKERNRFNAFISAEENGSVLPIKFLEKRPTGGQLE